MLSKISKLLNLLIDPINVLSGLVAFLFIYFYSKDGSYQSLFHFHEHFFILLNKYKFLNLNIIYTLIIIGEFVSIWLFGRLIKEVGYKIEKCEKIAPYGTLIAFYFKIASLEPSYCLLIPIIFCLAFLLIRTLKKTSIKNALLLGLVSSLACFYKFDALVYVCTFMLVFYFQFKDGEPISKKDFYKVFLWFTIGFLPFLVFLFYTRVQYKCWLPVDIRVLSLKQGVYPWKLITQMIVEPITAIKYIPYDIFWKTFPTLLIFLVIYNSFPWDERKQVPKDTLFYSLIWLTPAQSLFLACYSYILVPNYIWFSFAVSMSFAIVYTVGTIDGKIEKAGKVKELKRARRYWFVLGTLCFVFAIVEPIKNFEPSVYNAVNNLKEFAKENSGIYAMGNGASALEYFTGRKVIRLDGRGESKELFSSLKMRENFSDLMKKNNVSYYVSINPKMENNCYKIREPKQNRYGSLAGLTDWICKEPIKTIHIEENFDIKIFDFTDMKDLSIKN
ncbi:MAG: hypothetical protein MJ247_06545 [Alphaproteobacteria bacterium]|nr:hypothetical protein [Alphaproteobacteria bacterium]